MSDSPFVIVNLDTRKFVADPDREPDGQSYSTDVRYVRFYRDAMDAVRDKCGNEIVVSVFDL